MKQTFQVENVKCGGCASTLTTKLVDEFGEVEVDLDKMPREITLDITDENIKKLREVTKKLGYPFSDESLGFVDLGSTKAKSFVSCAIGKFEVAKGK